MDRTASLPESGSGSLGLDVTGGEAGEEARQVAVQGLHMHDIAIAKEDAPGRWRAVAFIFSRVLIFQKNKVGTF
jgi:hypothetical protein